MDRVKSGKDAWVSMLPVGMLVFGVGIMLISAHLALRLLGFFFCQRAFCCKEGRKTCAFRR